MNNYGGKREGSGRKVGFKAPQTIRAEKAREFFIQRVLEKAENVLTPLLDSAQGLWYEKVTSSGQINVYQKEPDVNAAKYLWDQTIGRPTETVKVKGEMELKLDV